MKNKKIAIKSPSPSQSSGAFPFDKRGTKKRIAIFYGGKMSKHLKLLREAAKKMKVQVDLISYNKVSYFVNFQFSKSNFQSKSPLNPLFDERGDTSLGGYNVIFFRTTGKHWEEVNLVVDWVKKNNPKCKIVDPLVEKGRPSDACKAWQMVELTKNKIEVPHTIYGSLWTLFSVIATPQLRGKQSRGESNPKFSVSNLPVGLGRHPSLTKEGREQLSFPVILKGSSGDRGTNVFKIDNMKQLEKKIRQLRKIEIEGGKRYMLQEFIPNDGDYRILVLGNKVLGAMKRTSKNFNKEFRNNFSVGGRVEVVEIPESIKKLAIKAAKVCGLLVAGVDVVYRNGDVKKPVVWEVNKGPQFWGFMEATGIDVPKEIIKFLIDL